MRAGVLKGWLAAWLLIGLAGAAPAQDQFLDEAVVESVQAIRRPADNGLSEVRCRELPEGEAGQHYPAPGLLRGQAAGASLSEHIRRVAAAGSPPRRECASAAAPDARASETLYLVRYRYQGEVYQVRMPTHPGPTLKVRVQLTADPATARAAVLP